MAAINEEMGEIETKFELNSTRPMPDTEEVKSTSKRTVSAASLDADDVNVVAPCLQDNCVSDNGGSGRTVKKSRLFVAGAGCDTGSTSSSDSVTARTVVPGQQHQAGKSSTINSGMLWLFYYDLRL